MEYLEIHEWEHFIKIIHLILNLLLMIADTHLIDY
jgi:hypothetical protein